MTDGPSPHLSWTELACKDGTPYPKEWRVSRGVALGRVFERIRAAAGNRPLTVLSAYRTPTHNAKVGGAKRSQHVVGRALDLRPPKGLTVLQFFHLVRGQTEGSEIRGVGMYPTFVHMDIRPGERVIVWVGTRVWAEMPQ